MWWLPVLLSLQTIIILLQHFVKKLCYDMGDKIQVQKGGEGAYEATLHEAALACFDLEAGGLQPAHNFLIINIDLKECCEEFRLTFDRKLLKAT